jgi:hypothetical protein
MMTRIKLAATVTMVSTWDVELRPKAGYYHVYYQNSWTSPEWTQWGVIAMPLDIREAAAAIGSLDDDGLSGDWLSSVKVTGLDGWRADILRMAAITSDSPCAAELEFLLRLRDDDIEWIYARVASLINEAGLQLVGDLCLLFGDERPTDGPIDLDSLLTWHGLDRSVDAEAIHRVVADTQTAGDLETGRSQDPENY